MPRAFNYARDVHQQRRARRIVHRAVVDAVPVLRPADADVIEMRGEHDVLVPQTRIGAREHAGDVL